MEKNQARSLIHQTFTQPFDKGRFLHFIKELLNRIDESKATFWNKTYVKDAFKLGINRYERLATYTDPSGEKIDILVVHLEKESSLERARTFLRNFVADYLVTRGQKEAALVAFVSPSEADWRFSLVKMEYTTKEAESGKVKVSENLTPARRYSFLVGENEDSHTAQAQLLDILADSDHNPTLEDLERAFGVERVTKEFFEQYKSLFLDLKDQLDELLDDNSRVRRDFEKKGVDIVDFAKKLLGQIVFLYFLQKKGWFGVARDAEWGTGPKNYLRLLFESRAQIGAFSKSGSSGVNFFNDVLEPLFYEALAKGDREDDYYGHFHCKIPFLNGGLFDPLNGYDWVHTDIILPDALFSNDERTEKGDKGTGILDVFDRYNFTVNEAEPLEKEVAVDPEMLGKVFENLLEVKERKSKGSFYTPREIVHYMCRQSLVSYLEKELAEASVPRLDIEALMRVGEQAADFELARLDKSTGYKPQLPKSIEANAPLLDRKLEEIAVCDPAVGSGAFLVGMMSEIVRARKTLTPYFSDRSPRTAYEFKRLAIQSSLYGVDIDPGAVEIAKLRLRLSLVVDEDDIKEIKPLPNLDYKIMQGDSLVEEFEGVKLFDKRMVEQPSLDLKAKKAALNARISELSRQFFDLHGRGNRDKPTRRAIEKEIDKLKKEMKALDTPVTASSLPAQREIGDLFSVAQCKLPELEHLHRQLFEASSGTLKKEIREKLTSLEWVIIEATVSDGIQQVQQKLDHLKQELDNSKRKKEPAKILQSLERKLNEMKAQKKEREDAAKHLASLRNASVKPFFLWRLHFLEVFQQKDGFDAVVSNPPYVLLQDSNRNVQLYKRFRDSYKVAAYKIDLYHLFIERAVHLLNSDGSVAFITPSNFTSNNYAVALRRFLLEETELRQLIFFDDDVFAASVNNVVFIAQRNGQLDSQVLFYRGKIAEQELSLQLKTQITQSDLVTEMCLLIPTESSSAAVLVEKLLRDRPPLGEIASVNFGMQLRDRSKFPNDVIKDPRKSELSKYHRPCYTGKDIRRYMVDFDGRYCYFNREAQRGGCWDEYIHKAKNKILVRQIGAYPEGGLDTNGYAVLNTAFIIVPRNGKTDPLWLLGILNSSCLRFFWLNRFRDDRKTFPKIKGEYLKLIPIPNGIDKALNHKLVQLVRQMITAKKEWAAAEDDYEKRRLDLFCADLDREIDRLVYELYDLTNDEIAIVEGRTQ